VRTLLFEIATPLNFSVDHGFLSFFSFLLFDPTTPSSSNYVFLVSHLSRPVVSFGFKGFSLLSIGFAVPRLLVCFTAVPPPFLFPILWDILVRPSYYFSKWNEHRPPFRFFAVIISLPLMYQRARQAFPWTFSRMTVASVRNDSFLQVFRPEGLVVMPRYSNLVNCPSLFPPDFLPLVLGFYHGCHILNTRRLAWPQLTPPPWALSNFFFYFKFFPFTPL